MIKKSKSKIQRIIRTVITLNGYMELTSVHANTIRALRNAGYTCNHVGYDFEGYKIYIVES